MVTTIGRWIHVVAASLFVIGIIGQAYLAGQGLPQLGGTSGFGAHIAFGYSIIFVVLAILIGALVGRVPRGQVGLSFALLALYFVQTSLPFAKADAPAIAALHPATAMLLLILAIYVAVRARRLLAGVTPAA